MASKGGLEKINMTGDGNVAAYADGNGMPSGSGENYRWCQTGRRRRSLRRRPSGNDHQIHPRPLQTVSIHRQNQRRGHVRRLKPLRTRASRRVHVDRRRGRGVRHPRQGLRGRVLARSPSRRVTVSVAFRAFHRNHTHSRRRPRESPRRDPPPRIPRPVVVETAVPTLGRRPSADLRARVVMTDAAEETPKGEKKPKDVTTAILERKKAPNRLIVGASRGDFHPHARSR